MVRKVISLILALTIGLEVNGHGMLWDPPGRSSMWRFHPGSPTNFDDNALYCGGAAVQWQQNEGKCGPCGDNWADPTPRANENGGLFGQGIIAKTYTQGSNIQVQVNITASHLGHFEFHLCNLHESDPETEACFAKRPVFQVDGSMYYEITPEEDHKQVHVIYLALPTDIICERCVLRWHYRAGNSVGICDDGTSGLGCGAQETFRNCADIAILKQ